MEFQNRVPMIGKFIDQIIPEENLPYTLTSYSPCFRKEKGAHGLEELMTPVTTSLRIIKGGTQ